MDPLTPPPSPKRTPARRSSHSKIPEDDIKLRAAPPSPSASPIRASSREKVKKPALDPLKVHPPSQALPPTRSSSYSTIPEEGVQPMAPPPASSNSLIRASPCEQSTKPILDTSTIHPPSPALPLTYSSSHSKIPEEELQPASVPPAASVSPMRASPCEKFTKPALDPLTIHPHSLAPTPTRSSSHAAITKKSSSPLTPPPSPPRSLKRTSSHSTHPKQAGDSKTKKAHRENTKVQLPEAIQPQSKPVKLESFAKRMESKSRKPQVVRLEEKKEQEIVGPANCDPVQTEPIDVANLAHVVEPLVSESLGKKEENLSEKPAMAHVGEEEVQQPISPTGCLSIQPLIHPKGKIIIHCLRHAQVSISLSNLTMSPQYS